ncbi:type IV secretion protein Rhs [Propioniciclava sinopodophylli]|uniref:Type IV secretion protein Rhs n=1 Tax=Propioniciclava sinopodophylli TaxID=1837344 RepID=A0A4Q9KBS3_9ACTN|nr:DUF6531 domain-containing protein [Propioniciclava sinopodophylli]TBT83212.1 type IV secretion protein Rhs [Propioniciclava sinopodophylli]
MEAAAGRAGLLGSRVGLVHRRGGSAGRPAAQPVSLSFAQPEQGVRDPLQGSGSTGTSSARPDHLRTFASNSRGANDDLASWPGNLRSAYDDFTAGCGFGSLEASTVWTGFDRYLSANKEDVRWADTVAAAFEAAGSDGLVTTSNAAITASLAAAGVNAERTQLTIDPPQAYGAPPTTGYANDPVNTATGNFLEPECDLGFAGGNATLRFDRMYNSLHPGVGAFGPGWSSLAEASLVTDAEGARWRHADGRVVLFPREGDGWARATSEAFWLAAAGDGLVVTDNAGGRWEFGATGTLIAVDRGPGTRVTLTWDGLRLAGLAHERGRSITVEWGGDRIVALVASDGRRVDYGYDDAGRLVAVSSGGATRTYDWNAAGLIERVTDADGVAEAVNTYDEQGRVVTQVSPHGRTTRFSYLPGRVTVVADPDGSRSNTWLHDDKGRLVGVIDAHDQRQSMAYDGHGQLVMATGRDGTVTLAEFDDRGRRTTQVLPSGARVDTVHDEADRPVEVVVDNDGVTATTRYAYTGAQRNPDVMTDAEGGVTRFTWDGNLLTGITDPTGVTVTHTYDAHGDLVATTDADGNTARLERDDAGRVTAAITPAGHRTTFAYDGRGALVSKTTPDGAVWAYEHTPAGRLAAVVDPYGARTTIERDAAGEASVTTDPLGRTVTRAFDDLGNLARVELPDGTTWQYAHDELTRLTSVTDPDGGQWRQEYDVNGAPTQATDPTGVTVRATPLPEGGVRTAVGDATSVVRTDTLGRIVSVQAPDGSSTLTRYDRCGRPVEYVDALGQVTSLERDAAGRVVVLRRPGGVETRYTHDRCGRLAAVTDATGATITFSYSPDGHLSRQVDPTGEATTFERDALGRVVRHRVPGLGTSTWAYDLPGRVVRARDYLWGTRRFRYDAAGQLVEAINALGGSTHYTYDALGRMVAITDPLGNTTRRAYNAFNLVVDDTDPLGRSTRAGYDAAGRQVWQEQPTGERLEWTHDARGEIATVGVDGVVKATFVRDAAQRSVLVTDHTADTPVEHRLRWDHRGRLIFRSRGAATTVWSYDELGRCTTLTTPNGATTHYGWDDAGALVSVATEGRGDVRVERDAAGRVVAAHAGGTTQTWTHRDGFVVEHTTTGPDGTSTTLIERDDEGRVTAVVRDGVRTTYEHDDAHQLVGMADGDHRASWTYDLAGRLVAEEFDGATTTWEHDAAGELLVEHAPRGTTRFSHDAQGRRTSQDGPDGRIEFSWGELGWLTAVTGRAGTTSVHVDALGELARVNDADVFWNAALGAGVPAQVDGNHVSRAPGFTGTGEGWQPTGWRTQRTATPDPWGTDAAGSTLTVGAFGELHVAGLEWLGARAYDPATRGFLSVDPLEPIAGAGWAHNPYSFAGNDPLHALDPTGLRPVTDAELQAYRDANQGALAVAGDWLSNNWEYLAGGAMVIAGGVLIATGVGGPAGMVLVGAGADTIIQKATTGSVNWGQVALSGALGGFSGAGLAARAGLTGFKATVFAGAASGGISGGIQGGYSYLTGPGPHSVTGFLSATGSTALAGTLLGGGGAAVGHGLTVVGGKVVEKLRPTPLVTNPGSLSDDMAQTFSGARYETTVLTNDTVLYRAGTEQRPLGQFFSHEPPGGVLQTQIDKAIPPVWPDGTPAPIDTAFAIKEPAGTEIHTGTVANQGGLWMGGTEQVVVVKPWEIGGVEVVDSWPLK